MEDIDQFDKFPYVPSSQINFTGFYQRKGPVKLYSQKRRSSQPSSHELPAKKSTTDQSNLNEMRENYPTPLINPGVQRGYLSRTPTEYPEEKLLVHPISKKCYFARSKTPNRDYIKARAKDYLFRLNHKRKYTNTNPEISDLDEYLNGPLFDNAVERKKNINFADRIRSMSEQKENSSPLAENYDIEKSQFFITKEPTPVRFDSENSYLIPVLNVFPFNTIETKGESLGQPQPLRRVGRERAEKKKNTRGGLKFVNIGTKMSHRTSSNEIQPKEIKPHIPLKPERKQQFFAKMMPLKSLATELKAPVRQNKAARKFESFYENSRFSTALENHSVSFNLAKLDTQEVLAFKNQTPTRFIDFNHTSSDVLQDIQRNSLAGSKPILIDKIKGMFEREQKISSEIKRTFQPFPYNSSQIKRKRNFLVQPNQIA